MNNEKMNPLRWAFMDYSIATNWGTGYDDNFPQHEEMSLKDLSDQVKFFQEPFYPENYKQYDGWEEFDKLFEERGFSESDIDEYFIHYRAEVRNGVVAEYLATFEANIE